MPIDIRDIRGTNYTSIYENNKMESYSSDKITNEELKKIAPKILSPLSSIIYGFNFVKDIAHCQLLATGLRNGLEENYQNNLYKGQQSLMYYKDLNAFLTGNLERMNDRMGLEKPITEEQTKIVAKLARECISLCLDKFDEDIKIYASKKRVSWSGTVKHIVEKTDKVYKAKRTVDEELKDNEGNGKQWRDRIRANKKLKFDKENERTSYNIPEIPDH